MKNSTPSPDPSSRVVKPRTPVLLVVSLVGGFLLLLLAIFFAVDQMQNQIIDARMTGIIVEKNFTPAPRQEVILDTRGNVQVRQREGDYSLTVQVRQRDGTTRDFHVSNVPQAMFESLEIGQRFDVGPYVLPPSASNATASSSSVSTPSPTPLGPEATDPEVSVAESATPPTEAPSPLPSTSE